MEGKYNTGVPIDINTISADERKIAFHEWAEGSEALEELLNVGYENGFLSYACCGGDTGHPYISYELYDDNSRKMAMYLAQQLIKSNLNCKIDFLHDFFDTEEEYKKDREHLIKNFPNSFTEENLSPTRTITTLSVYAKMENSEQIFKLMADTVREAQLDNVKLPQSLEEVPERNFDDPKIEKSKKTLLGKENMVAHVIKSSKENMLKVDMQEVLSELNATQNFIQNNNQPNIENGPEIEE